jgi:outer membrane murein-binding lipoprotein Lpp
VLPTTKTLTVLVLSATLLGGCAISTSISDSVSTSVESLSDSISSISPGGSSEEAAYDEDVQAYAAVFAGSPGSERDFLRGIGRVAGRHGISNWESRPGTLVAAGRGLRRGGMTEERMDELGSGLAELDETTARLVREGWESEAR